jgi:D-glycero-alpha-D-manno-heptose 1-phosphate guanylyltransferase
VTVAVILAGGLGTRLRSVVSDVPKPMANVLGRPFLEYLMDYWIAQGVSRFIVSVGYKRELIIEHFTNSYRGTEITYVLETHPLGTGGGMLLATQKLKRPFLLLNGDSFFKVELHKLIEFHENKDSEWTLSLFRANERDRYGGVEIDQNGQIHSFRPAKSVIHDLANGGVYYINPNVMRNSNFILGSKYSLEVDILPKLIDEKRKFFGMEFDAQFIDIGIPKDYFEAQSLLEN